MASISGKSLEELERMKDDLINAGKTLSTSKELGKIENAIKVLRPQNYGSKTVASAAEQLRMSTTPETQVQLGLRSSTAGQSGTGLATFGEGQPSIDLNSLYDQFMNSPELKQLEEELFQKKQARDTAEADINDNPFYSEATRVGKISKLDQKAMDEISTLQDAVAQKKADAQVKLNIAQAQYNIESQAYQNNLSKLNMLISSGAIANASGTDIAQIAQATGMSTDMVRGIVDNVKAGQRKTQVITTTDDSGNVTVSVIDDQGNIVNQNSLGTIGKASGGSGSGSDDKRAAAFESTVYKELDNLKKGENWGNVWTRVKTMFPEVPDSVIDSMLGGGYVKNSQGQIIYNQAGDPLTWGWAGSGAYEDYQTKQF